ncbi:MAG: Hpt domain-containing protein [Bacteroidales bacterium]
MSNYKHIDTELLKEVADGNNELILDLVDMYIEQAPKFSEQLENLLENKDYQTLSKLAHKIKGSLSTVGITMLAQEMKELEQKAKLNSNTEQYPTYINRYKRISNEAIVELKDIITRL